MKKSSELVVVNGDSLEEVNIVIDKCHYCEKYHHQCECLRCHECSRRFPNCICGE